MGSNLYYETTAVRQIPSQLIQEVKMLFNSTSNNLRIVVSSVGAHKIQLVAFVLGLFGCLQSASACDLNATTTNFSSQLAAAQSGQTVCLASGNYGTFAGVQKSSPGVTITTQSGATATMVLHFLQASPVAAWLILDGLTIAGGDISGPANNITVKNSTFTDKLNLRQYSNPCTNCSAMNNNNIVFDNDLFNMAANPSGANGYEGRINLIGGNDATGAGITIKNSKFTSGCADGIQVLSGGRGVTIGPNNEFFNLKQGSCGPHVDSIQFVGSDSPGPTITSNYFHDDETGIAAYDDLNSGTITNNVVVRVTNDQIDGTGMDSISIIEHNTVVGGSIGCGYTHEGNACFATFRNNITPTFSVGGTNIGGSTGTNPTYFDYNLCTSGSCTGFGGITGFHNLSGTPTFVGGTNPSSYSGYALSAGSLGHGAGSDGKDIGINVDGSVAVAPATPTNLTATVQ
jgi:hypothetical protein